MPQATNMSPEEKWYNLTLSSTPVEMARAKLTKITAA